MTPTLLSAAGSDVGRSRAMNQDSAATPARACSSSPTAWAGTRTARSRARSRSRPSWRLETPARGADLHDVDLHRRRSARRSTRPPPGSPTLAHSDDPQLRGTGTTLVAFLVDGTRVGVAHIGDSRAYLLRDGALVQLTHDHTLVQSLVDEGRITEQTRPPTTRAGRGSCARCRTAAPAEPDLFSTTRSDRRPLPHLLGRPHRRPRRRDGGRGAALRDRPRGGRGALPRASPTRAADRTTSPASSRTSSMRRPRRRERSSSAPLRRKASPRRHALPRR